jgi:hypothetical protein
MGQTRNPDDIIREYATVNEEVAKAVREYRGEATLEKRRMLCDKLRVLDLQGHELLEELDVALRAIIQ